MPEYIEKEVIKAAIRKRLTNSLIISWLIRIINEIPAAEVAPVVHGRWIPVPSSDMVTGKAYTCSECEKMRFGSFKPNYCPNCGARMDGDGNGVL